MNSQHNDVDKLPQKSSGRWVLGLIMGIPLVVIALSSVMYYLAENRVVELGTVNKGELISPSRQLLDIDPRGVDGEPLPLNQRESRWQFMVVGGRHCEADCERMLYLTRQTHTAMARRMGHVQRLYLSLEGEIARELDTFIDDQHHDVALGFADRAAFLELMEGVDGDPLEPGRFYVVDPRGWVILYYQPENTELITLTEVGKDVLKDMRRLIQ